MTPVFNRKEGLPISGEDYKFVRIGEVIVYDEKSKRHSSIAHIHVNELGGFERNLQRDPIVDDGGKLTQDAENNEVKVHGFTTSCEERNGSFSGRERTRELISGD